MVNAPLPFIRRSAPRFTLPAVSAPKARQPTTPRGSATPTVFLEQTLPVTGQGVTLLELSATGPFRIILTSTRDNTSGNVIVLEVSAQGANFRRADDNDPKSILKASTRPQDGVDRGQENAYWLSLDTQNRRLRYGKGYAQAQLTLLQWDYPAGDPKEIDPAKLPFAWTADLRYIALAHSGDGPFTPQIELFPTPVVSDLPALIVSDQRITMDELAQGKVTVVANLSAECKVLYANVAGADIVLDAPDFPDFSAAINYSIVTPDCVCYNLLKAKEGEFGKPNPRGTYLRITLGDNLGDSPGIPYVLEIWPGQNYSPIHNHAGADAVIKVLHGQIQSRWFAELSPLYLEYYEKFNLVAGDVTWLSPSAYQTHQLFNPAPVGQMCATLQCYRYPNADRGHYEYFDYLAQVDGVWTTQQFYPNSDMNYLNFKAAIRAEWDQVVANSKPT